MTTILKEKLRDNSVCHPFCKGKSCLTLLNEKNDNNLIIQLDRGGQGISHSFSRIL